jgi:hypothetical protein
MIYQKDTSNKVVELIEANFLHDEQPFLREQVKCKEGALFDRYLLNYLFTYLLTHSMTQNIIRKADCHSAYQKIFASVTEPEGSSPCSQKPTTEPYFEPAESSSPHRSPPP